MDNQIKKIAVIGAGVMGRGIAQLCAQSGYQTILYDAQNGAAERGKIQLISTFEKLLAKKKISNDKFQSAIQHVYIAEKLQELADCDLIIEAIVEKLEIKQQLFQEIENIVTPSTILASNTSSLSITSIAAKCQHPERVAGLHFFNPVPLMKVAEVISGLKTSPHTTQLLRQFTERLGHRAVIAKDTPGFIINHAGRAYGTEALKILNENVSTVEDIDRILRDGVGFKMGPFELLDLTGLDVSHPVMESIYHQYYEEPRYKPNPLTRQMLEAGQLGRKTGEGFYQYTDNMKKQTAPLSEMLSSTKSQSFPMVWVGADFLQDQKILENYLSQHNILIDSANQPKPESLCILASYGEDTTHACIRYMTDPSRTIAIDMLYGFEKHRTLMPSLLASSEMIEIAKIIFSLDGMTTITINESFGFVAQRVLAMVINLGCDIAQQQIATVDDINAAVRLGLGYPFGPIEWGDQLGAEKILLILKRISSLTADPRYRPSPWLQRRAILNLPLVFSQI